MPRDPRPPLEHPDLSDVPLTDVLGALADETRMTIVRTLGDEPAGRACGTFPVDVAPSTLSHHFKVLREAGVIRQEERGNRRWTTLRRDEMESRFPGLFTLVVSGD